MPFEAHCVLYIYVALEIFKLYEITGAFHALGLWVLLKDLLIPEYI